MAIRYSNVHWLWLSVAVIFTDQVTKQLIHISLAEYERIYVLPVLNIVHMHNTGAAFSILSGTSPLFFISLGIVVSIGVIWWLRRNPRGQTLVAIAFSLIQGGALGNVIDRATRGYVVDFIDFHIGECSWCHWPAFNVADSAIVIGAGLLILDMLQERKRGDTGAGP